MHRTLLNEADEKVLRSFLTKAFDELKEKDYEMYEELELDLYKEIHGCHFTEWYLSKALECMINEDNTKGGHWPIPTTTQVANNIGIKFSHFNEYDWNYVMNMLYSDFYKLFGNDTDMYAKIAKYFLEDKDAPEGKALKYHLAMKH